jgi:hypothetical protein
MNEQLRTGTLKMPGGSETLVFTTKEFEPISNNQVYRSPSGLTPVSIFHTTSAPLFLDAEGNLLLTYSQEV